MSVSHGGYFVTETMKSPGVVLFLSILGLGKSIFYGHAWHDLNLLILSFQFTCVCSDAHTFIMIWLHMNTLD